MEPVTTFTELYRFCGAELKANGLVVNARKKKDWQKTPAAGVFINAKDAPGHQLANFSCLKKTTSRLAGADLLKFMEKNYLGSLAIKSLEVAGALGSFFDLLRTVILPLNVPTTMDSLSFSREVTYWV